MSETELHPESQAPESELDEDDRLKPEFVRAVLEAVEAGDAEAARALVEPLHPADIADLFELTPHETAAGAGRRRSADLLDGDVLAEMNDWVREDADRRARAAPGGGHRRRTRYRRRRRDHRGHGGRGPARSAPRARPRRSRRDRGSALLSRGIRRPPDAARADRGARALDRRRRARLSAARRRADHRFLGNLRGRSRAPSGRHLPAFAGSCARRARFRSPT